jgi:glucan phosphoethanolaminetransferase (alkaline phosphatase superfamily)
MAIFVSDPMGVPSEFENSTQAKDPFNFGAYSQKINSPLADLFPFELGWALIEHLRTQAVASEVGRRLAKNDQVLSVLPGAKEPEVMILIIGESSSRQDWGIFNEKSPNTTPRLLERTRSDRGLYLQTNVIAQSVATRYAVPPLLTDQPIYWANGRANEKASHSLISVARRAGYWTGWFSNQSSGGESDSVQAIYAKEAEAVAFINPSSYSRQGSYDGALLPLVEGAIDKENRIFLVIHTLGSHFRFSHRYPPSFEKFKPSESAYESTGSGNSNETLNAYRNSILYTDYFIDSVIGVLETSRRSAVLIYVSDHGQGIAEEGCDKSPINRSMARAYEVPSLVWISAEYRKANPDVPKRIELSNAAPLTTKLIYQTMIDFLQGGVADDGRTGARPSYLRQNVNGDRQLIVTPQMQWEDFSEAAKIDRCNIREIGRKK